MGAEETGNISSLGTKTRLTNPFGLMLGPCLLAKCTGSGEELQDPGGHQMTESEGPNTVRSRGQSLELTPLPSLPEWD